MEWGGRNVTNQSEIFLVRLEESKSLLKDNRGLQLVSATYRHMGGRFRRTLSSLPEEGKRLRAWVVVRYIHYVKCAGEHYSVGHGRTSR